MSLDCTLSSTNLARPLTSTRGRTDSRLPATSERTRRSSKPSTVPPLISPDKGTSSPLACSPSRQGSDSVPGLHVRCRDLQQGQPDRPPPLRYHDAPSHEPLRARRQDREGCSLREWFNVSGLSQVREDDTDSFLFPELRPSPKERRSRVISEVTPRRPSTPPRSSRSSKFDHYPSALSLFPKF